MPSCTDHTDRWYALGSWCCKACCNLRASYLLPLLWISTPRIVSLGLRVQAWDDLMLATWITVWCCRHLLAPSCLFSCGQLGACGYCRPLSICRVTQCYCCRQPEAWHLRPPILRGRVCRLSCAVTLCLDIPQPVHGWQLRSHDKSPARADTAWHGLSCSCFAHRRCGILG